MQCIQKIAGGPEALRPDSDWCSKRKEESVFSPRLCRSAMVRADIRPDLQCSLKCAVFPCDSRAAIRITPMPEQRRKHEISTLDGKPQS